MNEEFKPGQLVSWDCLDGDVGTGPLVAGASSTRSMVGFAVYGDGTISEEEGSVASAIIRPATPEEQERWREAAWAHQ